jgi:hypothetical protein
VCVYYNFISALTTRRRHLKCIIHTLAAAGEIDPESVERPRHFFSLKLPLLAAAVARDEPKAPSHCSHIVLHLFIKIFALPAA